MKKLNADRERGKIVAYLCKRDIPYTRPNPYQIKIGDLNFYPSTGTIVRDGCPGKEELAGADALIAMLEKNGSRSLDAEIKEISLDDVQSDEGWQGNSKRSRL